MAITQAMCDSFKVQILAGQQNLTSGATPVYKIANNKTIPKAIIIPA